jgi:hypothetical protein
MAVLPCRLRNISQKGLNRLRRSKIRHRHTRDCPCSQHSVVIPLAKRLAGTTEKVEKVKICVARRQGMEEGRTKFRQVFLYHLYKCNVTASAVH